MDNQNFDNQSYQISENQESQFSGPDDALGNFDFSKLESLDPSLSNNHKIIYIKEVPMDLKLENEEGQKDVCSFEPITCKILYQGKEKEPSKVRIELSCENDLFFHFTSDVNENVYKKMKEKQNLTTEFKDYIPLLIRLFDDCINQPQVYIAVFIMKKKGAARLEIVKGNEFKFLECFNIDFMNSSDETIKKQMIYRFSALKSKFEHNKKCVQIAGDVIMSTNPNLINDILDCNENYNANVNLNCGKNLCLNDGNDVGNEE